MEFLCEHTLYRRLFPSSLAGTMNILLWAWLIWKGAWCASPEPGVASSGYVGIGYNLLTANPDGGEQSQGGADPGLLLTRQVLDVSDPRAVQQQHRHNCVIQRTVSMFYGARTYQQKLQADVNVGGKKKKQNNNIAITPRTYSFYFLCFSLNKLTIILIQLLIMLRLSPTTYTIPLNTNNFL